MNTQTLQDRLSELKADRQKSITGIHTCNAQNARLSKERESLFAKRRQAENAIGDVEIAREVLSGARAELSQCQSDIFINGGDIDMTHLTGRVSSGEKRLRDLANKAVPANAALPHILERLLAIEKEMGTIEEVYEGHYVALYVNRERIAIANFRYHAHGMLDSLHTILALGKHTKNNLGWRLLEGVRAGLLVPTDDGHAERVNTGPWAIPDVTDELRRLDAEILAELDATPREDAENPL